MFVGLPPQSCTTNHKNRQTSPPALFAFTSRHFSLSRQGSSPYLWYEGNSFGVSHRPSPHCGCVHTVSTVCQIHDKTSGSDMGGIGTPSSPYGKWSGNSAICVEATICNKKNPICVTHMCLLCYTCVTNLCLLCYICATLLCLLCYIEY